MGAGTLTEMLPKQSLGPGNAYPRRTLVVSPPSTLTYKGGEAYREGGSPSSGILVPRRIRPFPSASQMSLPLTRPGDHVGAVQSTVAAVSTAPLRSNGTADPSPRPGLSQQPGQEGLAGPFAQGRKPEPRTVPGRDRGENGAGLEVGV